MVLTRRAADVARADATDSAAGSCTQRWAAQAAAKNQSVLNFPYERLTPDARVLSRQNNTPAATRFRPIASG
jgi:hypothetical protein